MKHRTAWTATLALLIAGAAQAQFGPLVETSIGTPATNVVAADFDGDGDLDLVQSHTFQDVLVVFERTALGTWIPAVVIPVGQTPGPIAVADYDNDGLPDIAVAANAGNVISIVINAGNLTFAPAVNYPAGVGPTGIVAEDLDLDGDLDILVTALLTSQSGVLTNLGGGIFAFGGSGTVIGNPGPIKFADLDFDGDRDMVVTLTSLNAVFVLERTPTGFNPIGAFPTGIFPIDVLLVDINHDGFKDIVTCNLISNTISVLRSQGGFNFAPAVSYAAGLAPTSVVAVNVDNALGLDLVVATFDAGCYTYFNNGLGTFTPGLFMHMGITPLQIIAHDFDGDLDTDILTLNVASATRGYRPNPMPVNPFPGTNVDLDVLTGVNGPTTTGPGAYIKVVHPGDTVTIDTVSIGGTLTGLPAGLGVQVFLEAFPPISPFAGLHLNQFGFGGFVVAQAGNLPIAGLTVSFMVPTIGVGFSIMAQSGAYNPQSAHSLDLSHAHEIRIR